MKYATTLDEQVEKLKNRGLVINDEEKAKEVLLDNLEHICSHLKRNIRAKRTEITFTRMEQTSLMH